MRTDHRRVCRMAGIQRRAGRHRSADRPGGALHRIGQPAGDPAGSERLPDGDSSARHRQPYNVGQTITQGTTQCHRRIGLSSMGPDSNGRQDLLQIDAAINEGNSGGLWSMPAATWWASPPPPTTSMAIRRATASASPSLQAGQAHHGRADRQRPGDPRLPRHLQRRDQLP